MCVSILCVCVCYLQQASALREVWLSILLSVSEVMVGSLLGSVGSVDIDETSLAEEEEEEEDVGWGGLSITAAPVLRKTQVNVQVSLNTRDSAVIQHQHIASCDQFFNLKIPQEAFFW